MIGLVVNPVAGLGGAVGLKGTDGLVEEARARGAVPRALERAAAAVAACAADIPIACAAGALGEDALRLAGRTPALVVGQPVDGETDADDTRRAARALLDAGVELLLFAGGDGTARDIHAAIGDSLTVLGVPAGVKIQSAAFAESPRKAGELASAWTLGRRRERVAEVIDTDVAATQGRRIGPALYGTLRVPLGPGLVSGTKAPSHDEDPAALAGIAARMAERARTGLTVLGPGTTVAAIGDALGLETTLLGVDVVRDGTLIARDASEADLLATIDGDATVIVTPIGRQGFILGRGNQQLSPAVLERCGIGRLTVVATPAKLALLGGRPLLVDTGEERTDRELRGWHRVVTGYDQETVYPVE